MPAHRLEPAIGHRLLHVGLYSIGDSIVEMARTAFLIPLHAGVGEASCTAVGDTRLGSHARPVNVAFVAEGAENIAGWALERPRHRPVGRGSTYT